MKPRKLYPLKPKTGIQDDFFVFDTETGTRKRDGSIQWKLNARPESFIFGVIHGRNYTRVIHDRKEFILALQESQFKGKKVFAHNAEYDLTVLYGNIFDLDPEAIFNGKFISATNGNCVFADSLNIYRASVKEIGRMIGIEKPELGNDQMISPKGVGPDEINRCVKDCEIIYEALCHIFEDAGDIKITQASLSLTYFRRHHLDFPIEHNANTAYFWDSYFGGRCEAFKIGKTHAQVLDVNSMYPYAMKHCEFPNPGFLKVETNKDVKYFINVLLNAYEGLVYCEVEHPATYFGMLPVKKGGKLIFPVGRFSGCWNFNELRFAIDNGLKILKVSKVVYSEKIKSPFIDFVDTLYLKRFQSTNELETFRIKIFMNSLYGKFAQKIDEDTIYIKDINKQIDEIRAHQKAGRFIKLVMFNSKRLDAFLVTKSVKNISLSYSIPSFASYITSFARVMLLKKLFEMQKHRVVYCDTDSIFYEVDSNEIKSSMVLGEWKKEDKIITEIRGLKNYKYISAKDGKEYRRLKGVPNKAEKLSETDFKYFNLIKTKEGLRRKKDPGELIERNKHIKGEYSKRIVFTDGTTQPIKI